MNSDIFSQEIVNGILKRMTEEKEKRHLLYKKFVKSILFNKIVRQIIEKNIVFDSEELSYFPEKIIQRFDMTYLTEDELFLFTDCMIDDNIIPPTHTFSNKDFIFDNSSEQKLGLCVFMMHGQGTFIRISPALKNDHKIKPTTKKLNKQLNK